LFLLSRPARAGGPPTTAPASQVLELHLRPAATPQPALKYSLIPDVADLTPGNAAPLYLMTFLSSHLTADEQKQITELLAAPRDRFKPDAARQIITSRATYFANLDLAARRDHCRWEIPLREQGFATILPQLAPCRDAARLIALKTRVETAEGHFDQA